MTIWSYCEGCGGSIEAEGEDWEPFGDPAFPGEWFHDLSCVLDRAAAGAAWTDSKIREGREYNAVAVVWLDGKWVFYLLGGGFWDKFQVTDNSLLVKSKDRNVREWIPKEVIRYWRTYPAAKRNGPGG